MIRRPSQVGQKSGLDWMVGPRLRALFIKPKFHRAPDVRCGGNFGLRDHTPAAVLRLGHTVSEPKRRIWPRCRGGTRRIRPLCRVQDYAGRPAEPDAKCPLPNGLYPVLRCPPGIVLVR